MKQFVRLVLKLKETKEKQLSIELRLDAEMNNVHFLVQMLMYALDFVKLFCLVVCTMVTHFLPSMSIL